MEKGRFFIKNAFTVLLCFCTALMFNLKFEVPEIQNDAGVLYNITENLRQSITLDFFATTIIALAFYFITLKINQLVKSNIRAQYICNLILAFLWLFSEGFQIDNTLTSLYSSPGQVVKSILYVIGAAHLLNSIGNILYLFLSSQKELQELPEKKTVFAVFSHTHPYLFWFLLVLIVWIPNTILSHPASIESDVWDSLHQFFGWSEFTAHHPPFFTVLIGWFASFGISLGSINTGFFLWTMLQTLLCAAIMAYVLYTIQLLKAPYWLTILSFLIAALSPYYTSYITTIVKDTPYSFAVLLYLVELVYLHLDWKQYWKSPVHIGLFFSSNIAMILFRHNGKYILYVMGIYLLFRCIFKKPAFSKKSIAFYGFLLILPLLIANGISNIVIHQYHVTVQKGESMREALSIPFQQTARYAKYYGEETPEEEKAIIDTVIDYYALAGVYEPGISDPVKARFQYTATAKDWAAYFKVWLKQFFRHPMTYFEATLNQNYYLVYPMQENSRFYYSTYVDYFYDHEFMNNVGAAQTMTFAKANDTRISFYKLLHSLPISGAFSNIAVYNILLMYLIIFAVHDRQKGFMWITIPVLISNLVVLAGPAIYDNIRYALPIVYAMPLVTAYFIQTRRSR